MLVTTKEVRLYRNKRVREEAQAEINRTNNVKLEMLEDKGSLYHYAKLTVKHNAISDVTTELMRITKEYMVKRYDVKIEIIEKERSYTEKGVVVIVALRKIKGEVRKGYSDYKKAITYAKRKLKLDTSNSQRTKENKDNGENGQEGNIAAL